MTHKIYHATVILLWLVAMTWLVVEKVLPPLMGGDPPDYNSVLAARDPPPVWWKITWNDETMGYAGSRVVTHGPQGSEMRSVVQLEKVPMESILSELMGAMARFMTSWRSRQADLRIDALVATQLWFDAERRVSAFHTRVGFGEIEDALTIDGVVRGEGQLHIRGELGPGLEAYSPERTVLDRQLDLPAQALVADAFTPRSELRDLHVGQKWTIPVYRPFPPGSSVQIVEAEVIRHDVILWEARDMETFLIEYRTDPGSGVRAGQQAVGREWVARDGRVLRQELTLSGLTFRFERMPEAGLEPVRRLLDDDEPVLTWPEAPPVILSQGPT